ncbi:MAG TPA: DUF4136 domain-containing protein [Candidatus Acidoferrum sp.]|nr:DUF4136 domain-containing protein [Candidatus Acidoferrum sp.]
MKLILVSFLAAGAVLLAGCSSTPTRVNTGAVHADTFSFVTGRPAPPDYAEKRAEIHRLIQSAITTNLTAKGLSRAPAGGDVFVAYLLILGNNVSTTDVNDYFGYGRDADALLDKAHEKSAIDSKNPNPYEAGALVIDIIDAKTYKLLYRNYAAREVLRNLPEDARAIRIQQAVDQALAGLRIAK